MIRRFLGSKDNLVSGVGIGAMSFTNFYGKTNIEESHAILKEAINLDINHIDTSNVYGMGQSEEAIGSFLKNQGRQKQNFFKIATKAAIQRDPNTSKNTFNNNRKYLKNELVKSLRRLGLENIDLFYVHRRDPNYQIEEVTETLLSFVNEGLIKHFGFSEIAPSSLRRAQKIGHVGAVQSEYSLSVRGPELGLLQSTMSNNTTFVAFSPVGRGLLTDSPPSFEKAQTIQFLKNNPRFQKMNLDINTKITQGFRDFAKELGVKAASLAIAWILHQGDNIITIPGTRSVLHLKELANGGLLKLKPNELKELEKILYVGWCHGDRYSVDQWVGPEKFF